MIAAAEIDAAEIASLLIDKATILDEIASFRVLHPEPHEESTDEVRAEWSALCLRSYTIEGRFRSISIAYAAEARRAGVSS